MNKQLLSGSFLLKLFKDSASEWSKDNAMRLAAALSYYSAFSMAPLLLIAIGIIGWFYGAKAEEGLLSQNGQLTAMIGAKAAEALQTMVASASKSSSSSTAIGFITLLVGASTVFGELKSALDSMWEVTTKPGLGIWNMIRERLLTFGMVLVIGFLLLISLVLTTTVAAAGKWMEGSLGVPTALSGILAFVVPVIVEVGLFALIFRMLPSADVPWKYVFTGAVMTAVLFEAGKLFLSWYLARASTTSAFGAAGSLIILLLWVYYASCILFFGAAVTEVYARLSGQPIQPGKNAITTECKAGDPAAAGTPARVPSEPDPLNPHVTPPSFPARESLVPLLRQAHRGSPRVAGPRVPPQGFAGHVKAFVEDLHSHPVAEVGAALGVGLAAGFVSRIFEKRERTYTAGEHLRLGAQSAAEEGKKLARRLAAQAPKKVQRWWG